MPETLANPTIYSHPDNPFPRWIQVAGDGLVEVEEGGSTMFYRAMKLTPAPSPLNTTDAIKMDSVPWFFTDGDTVAFTAAFKRDGTQAAFGCKVFFLVSGTWSATIVTLPAPSTSWQIVDVQAVAPGNTTAVCVQLSTALNLGEAGAGYWAVAQSEHASTAVNLAADSVTAAKIAAGAVQTAHLDLRTSSSAPIPLPATDGTVVAYIYAEHLTGSGNRKLWFLGNTPPVGEHPTIMIFTDESGNGLTVSQEKAHLQGTAGIVLDSSDFYRTRVDGGTIKETSGASAPGSPSTGDRHYFTSAHLWGYWTGSQWLSEEEFEIGDWQYYVGAQVGVELTATQEYRNTELRDDYAHYLTRWRVRWYVSTTNNGTHNYTIALRSFPTTGTTLASVSTATGAANTFTPVTVTSFTQPSLGEGIQQYITKNNSPGGLRFSSKLFARLVLT